MFRFGCLCCFCLYTKFGISSDWTSTILLFVAVLVGFMVDLLSDFVSLSVSKWVRRSAPNCDYKLCSVKHGLKHISYGATFLNTFLAGDHPFLTL